MAKKPKDDAPTSPGFDDLPSEPIMTASAVIRPKRGCGYIADPVDVRDYQANALLGAPRNLPAEASLEQHVRQVRNQESASSCVGQAIAQAADVRLARLGFQAPQVSALAVYTMARALARFDAEQPLRDEGSQARMAMKGARDNGLVAESRWPHDLAKIDAELPWDVLQQASAFRVAAWYRINAEGVSRTQEVCNAISQGWPVVFAAQVDGPFQDHYGKGLVPPYAPAKGVGGHMMCLVGYRLENGRRLLRGVNSWGEGWGDHGFFWADQAWLEATTVGDLYVLQIAAN